MVESKRTNLAIGVVLNDQGKVLIIKRVRPENAQGGQVLTWSFPGGPSHEEEGATPEESVVKHIKDETGYKTEVVRKISERDYPQPFVHLNYFECKISQPTVKPINDIDEVEKLRWVEPGELKDFFTTDLDHKVAEFLGL